MVTKWHPRPSRLLTRCFKLPLPPSPLKFFWIFLSWFFFFFFYYITRPSNSLLIFRSSLARYLLPALLKDELQKYYEKKFNLRNHRSIPLNFRETQNKNKKKKKLFRFDFQYLVVIIENCLAIRPRWDLFFFLLLSPPPPGKKKHSTYSLRR